jgi:aminoglycoside phosphotransferase family enzyme/gluconate kinase
MLDPEIYDHPVKHVELIETHISWVLLTGGYAYKIKKPVDFGFLDFSTLEKRRQCCEQELRLNGRLAASIYLDVVSITGSPDQPAISGKGEAFEYAVKMRQFPQSAQLDHKLEAGELAIEQMDDVASMVAGFHQRIDAADETVSYGSTESVFQPVEQNFVQIREHLNTNEYEQSLKQLEQWSRDSFIALKSRFEQRKKEGYIRECHGDMHLRNIVWLDEGYHQGPLAFDCIEFNDNLRWIDVISEVAFLVMDLQSRNLYSYARRFLNSYLEDTGDYAGVMLLPYYLGYRAMVRAKVSVLRLQQAGVSAEEKRQMLDEFEQYLELASGYAKSQDPVLIVMRGASASGKSTVSRLLLDATDAIRIRSDVERKRLYGVPHAVDNDHEDGSEVRTIAQTAANSIGINEGIYSAQASVETYGRLIDCATSVLSGGYSAIIDAAFLKLEQRLPFQQLAEQLGVGYVILEVTAPDEVLRQRILARKNDVSDADLDVLNYQLENWQPLSTDEHEHAIQVNTEQAIDMSSIIKQLPLSG